MVRPVETIRREIDSLNQATVALAAEFNRLYTSYLDSLGLALRRQVILATYHLCTQVYPEGFLALSVGQREKLQSSIRQLGLNGATWLQQLMESMGAGQARLSLVATADSDASSPTPEAESDELPLETTPSAGADQPLTDEPPQDSQVQNEDGLLPVPTAHDGDERSLRDGAKDAEAEDEAGINAMRLPSLIKSMMMAALAEEMSESLGDRLFVGDDMTPTRLAKQHIFIEQQIREILQRVSKQGNHLLQAAQVIPNLPEAVVDAASETDVGSSRSRSVPNVLSVLVAMAADMDENLDKAIAQPARTNSRDKDEDDEDDDDIEEDDDEPREGLMTHLAVINLRLSDIEFADVQTSLWRSKLRNALGQLRRLGKQYQKAQREMAISEAEQAWRAVWYDDLPRSEH